MTSTFKKAAKEAGVDQVVCPQCGARFTTGDVIKRFFRGVLELVRRGEHIHIPDFGVFTAKVWKGRSHATPIIPSGQVAFGDTWVLRFKQSKAAKLFLNRSEADAATGAATKARHEAVRQEKRAKIRSKASGKQV